MRTLPHLRIREVRNHRIRPPPARNDSPKELVGGPTTSTANATTDTTVRDHHSLSARQGNGNGRRTVTTAMRQQGADPVGQFSTQRLEILRDETRQDAELMELQTIIHDGWPEKRKEVPAEIRKYWAFRGEMAVADGLVTKGDCVIIPKTLRRDILEKLHAAHQGIEKTRLRART